ncbi:MAG: hypothetical protein KDD99_28180, partial [Bacteroidetes bacterium]|nr:hypothetical protein [Bacteroidota bacterium]
EIRIPVQWLGLYSAMIHFYLGKTRDIKGFEDIRKNYESIVQKHTWGQGIKAGLFAIIIFLFFGGNASVFGFFRTRYVKNQIAQHQEILRQIQNNQDFISQKSAFLSGIELKHMVHSRASFYIDQIASQASSFLQFEKLTFHPTPENLKKTDPSLVELNPDILITGISQTAEEITLFSLKIEELPFIEKVNVFQKKYDFQAEIHRFVLLIDLKP